MIFITQIFKSNIKPIHRKFYLYSGKLLVDYKHITSIDSVWINIKLTNEQIEHLKSTYKYYRLKPNSKGEPPAYKYCTSKGNVLIKFCPLMPITNNAQIQLQDASNISNNSLFDYTLKLLHSQWHYIKRLDIAFDYLIPFKYSFVLRYNGNQTMKIKSPTSYNIGSYKNKSRSMTLAHYDRNEKEKARAIEENREPAPTIDYANRFECRTWFTYKDNCNIHNINHDFICKQLNKQLFIPNYHLYFDDEMIKLIDSNKTKGNETIIRDTLTPKQYRTFRTRYKANSVDLVSNYKQAVHNDLYDFLKLDDVERSHEQVIDELLA